MASELQVNTITEATSGSGITFAKDVIPATPLSHRNMIINGGINVSQRYGTSSASLSGSNTGDYTVDRFALIIGSSYNLDTTTTQVSGDPNETGQSKALKIECDTVQNPSATHNGGVFTKLEGQDLQRLLYGTASAKNSVLTFWAKAGGSGAGQYTCQIKYLKSGPTYYVQYHTFTLTTSWQKFTINLNANGTATSQPIIDDNTAGMEIYWWLVAGSSDLVSASSTEKELKKSKGKKIDLSNILGELLAKRAKEKKINSVYFDRGGYKYHGRIKALADSLRKNGLKI